MFRHCTRFSKNPSYQYKSIACADVPSKSLIVLHSWYSSSAYQRLPQAKIWSRTMRSWGRVGRIKDLIISVPTPHYSSPLPPPIGTSLHLSGFSFPQRRACAHVLSTLRHWSKSKGESLSLCFQSFLLDFRLPNRIFMFFSKYSQLSLSNFKFICI